MGNQNNKSFNDFLKENIFVQDLCYGKFGDCQLYKEKKSDKLLLCKGKLFNSVNELTDFSKKIEKHKEIQHPNLININFIKENNEPIFCGEYSKIYLFFEFYNHTLFKEIQSRRSENAYFTEPELWYILETLINVFSYLQINRISIKNITNSTFFIKQSGEITILDQNWFENPYYQYLQGNFDDYPFLSKELLYFLLKKSISPQINWYKNDVFSLGICFLELMSLEYAKNIYNYNEFEILESKIKKIMEKIKEKYSEKICSFIEKMLWIEEKRPDFRELKSYFEKKVEKINKYKIFDEEIHEKKEEKKKNFNENYESNNSAQKDVLTINNNEEYFENKKNFDNKNIIENKKENEYFYDLEKRINEAIKMSQETIYLCNFKN